MTINNWKADRPHVTEETACVLCGERNYDVVGTRDRDGRPLRTTICRQCGMVWTNPRPTRDDIEQYYRHQYRSDYQHTKDPGPRKVLRGMLGAFERRRLVMPLVAPGTQLLDIGCGAGEFVYVLRAMGVDASGIEPDEAFAHFASEVLRVPMRIGVVEKDAFPPASFDVITMFHALEHTAEPVETLSVAASWLRPSGSFVVEVPNVDARCQAPHHRFHYAHLFSFSPGTLNAAAVKAGLVPVRTQLTEDGGNIIAFFQEGPFDRLRAGPFDRLRAGPASAAAVATSSLYDRTREILCTHTAFRHYLSPAPYVRAVGRLRRRWREDRLLRRLKTMKQILAWAEQGGLEH